MKTRAIKKLYEIQEEEELKTVTFLTSIQKIYQTSINLWDVFTNFLDLS